MVLRYHCSFCICNLFEIFVSLKCDRFTCPSTGRPRQRWGKSNTHNDGKQSEANIRSNNQSNDIKIYLVRQLVHIYRIIKDFIVLKNHKNIF